MRTAAAYAALTAAAAAPALALAPIYTDPLRAAAILALWPAAAVPLTALALRGFAAPAALLLLLPLPVAGVAALAYAAPGPVAPVAAATLDAVANSGARIVTTAVPSAATVDLLALPALAGWLCAAAAVPALRGGRPLLAVSAPLPVLAGATVLKGPDAPHAYGPVALYALASIAVLVLASAGPSRSGASAADARRASRGGGADRLRRSAAVSAVVAVGAAATTYIGPLALYGSSVAPADLRDAAEPEEEDTEGVSPLSHLPQWAAEPDRPLLSVAADEPTELRWVTLSEFDGITWRPDRAYRASSEVLPEPEALVPPGEERSVEVEVHGLPGGWLPVAGVPHRVEGAPVAYDPASFTVRAAGADDGLEGLGYTATGTVPSYDEEALAAAEAPDPDRFERHLRLPEGAPGQLRSIAALVEDATPYQRANRLAGHLRSRYGYDPEAPGGHGYATLDRLLVEPGEDGGGGTSEQFASAFALLARAAGLPSRVVVGFGAGAPDGDGVRLVRTGDAVAWGEVYLDGVGWTPFDATPGEPEHGGASPVGEMPGGEGGEDGGASAGREEPDDSFFRTTGAYLDVGFAWRAAALAVAAVPASVLVIGALIAAARALHRHRRFHRRPGPELVAGAWRELRDALRLSGAPPGAAATAAEVVAAADRRLPPEPGGEREWSVGAAVTALAFAPEADRGIGADAARRAADEVREYTRALRRSLPLRRRLLWWADPRPLLRRPP
ncbi:DUF3488 and transglutaminase-like domain-containing protein [Nocardiopsis potens]|uniref:DUF3488 and transglutaminase-like domain-containing protein n=1 Tax=Nocardiopsis potens TaxID=1246458 RepID=UPI000349DC46|nr:transglutaminase domain-containing protein [Nocardiopsis potens]